MNANKQETRLRRLVYTIKMLILLFSVNTSLCRKIYIINLVLAGPCFFVMSYSVVVMASTISHPRLLFTPFQDLLDCVSSFLSFLFNQLREQAQCLTINF